MKTSPYTAAVPFWIFLSLCGAACPAFTLCGATFQGLGDLPGSIFYSYANSISPDGKVVVGASASSISGGGTEPFRWTARDGMVGLGELPGGGVGGAALAASHDGSIIVGVSTGTSGHQAFRWTLGSGMVGLPDSTGHWPNTMALAISGNGQVLVGYGSSTSYGQDREAIQWPGSGSSLRLGDLPGAALCSTACDVSSDASVIVGNGESVNGNQAFVWTEATGMLPLGDLPGGSFTSSALAVSDDGKVIVGFGLSSTPAQEAFRWTAESGMVGLGFAPGDTKSVAYAVSADGNTIVGGNESGEALIWQPASGMRHLRDVLTQDYHLDLKEWELTAAMGVSADGLRIVGWGVNPSDQMEGWLANLGAPSLALERLGNELTLFWETNASGFTLERSLSIDGSAEWVPVAKPVAVVGTCFVVYETATDRCSFYRLRK